MHSHKSILLKVHHLLKLLTHTHKASIELGAKTLSCLRKIKHVKQIESLPVQIQFVIMMLSLRTSGGFVGGITDVMLIVSLTYLCLNQLVLAIYKESCLLCL